MSLDRFTEADWQRAAERLKVSRSRLSIETLKSWLETPLFHQQLVDSYGEDWTLDDAVDLATTIMDTGKGKLGRPRAKPDYKSKAVRVDEGEEEGLKMPRVYGPKGRDTADAQSEESDDDLDAILAGSADKIKKIAEERLKLYLESYKDIEIQDRARLEALSMYEAQEKVLQDIFNHNLNKPYYVRSFGEGVGKMAVLIRGIQKDLGIDRATRDKQTEQTSDVDAIRNDIREVGKWVLAQSIQVVHCNILIAVVTSEFLERNGGGWWVCPKCNERVEWEHIPTPEQIAGATPPPWVEQEEAEGVQRMKAEDTEVTESHVSEEKDEGEVIDELNAEYKEEG